MKAPQSVSALCLLLALGCTDFPVIEENVCGNGVVEKDVDKGVDEDCDSFADPGFHCVPPGIQDACHYDCRPGADNARSQCPEGMGCSESGICRRPTGGFDKGVIFAPGVSSWLTTADFDGDGRLDVISTEAADELRQARFRIHYFDADANLDETRTFPRVVSRPSVRRVQDDAADDLIFSNGLIAMVAGRADREWIPEAFSSYVLPGTRLRAVSVRSDGVSDAIGLAIFSDFAEGGPGVYVPSLDDSTLLLRARFTLPFEDLAPEPLSADLVTGPASPCSELVYAFLGDDSVHVLDLCEPNTVPFGSEVLWRAKPIEQIVRLPGGAKVTTAPQVADVDGDGQLDILVTSEDETFVAYNASGALDEEASPLILRSHEDGKPFALSPPLASGDITGDGVIDFVMPTGILASHTSLVDGQLGYFEPYENSAKPWTTAVIADLNGNGLPDVIAGSEGSPGLSFLSGTGGPFQNHTSLSTQGPLRFLSVGDYDGDRLSDVAYVQSGPRGKDDTLAIAFGQRDTFPLPERRVAQVSGVQQLGSASQQGGSSLFSVSRDKLDGVVRSKFTLFDGSPERLPFAPYALVTFSVNGSLADSLARVLAGGAFTAPGASDLFVVAGKEKHPEVWSMWLVPDVGGSERPPQLLQPDTVPPDAIGATLNKQGGQLSAAAAAADLEGDGFDEALVLMPKGVMGEGCYLLIYDLDGVASSATSKGVLTFDTPCPDPELATLKVNGDKFPDLLLLIGDSELAPRQLLVLFNDENGGFSLDNSLVIGVEGHDIRGFSAFTQDRGASLALITEEGLYQASISPSGKLDELTRLQTFVDARSVVVTDPDGDRVQDIAVADAAGVSLVRAQLE